MSWNMKTYQTSKGEQPVDEFIKAQQSQAIAKIAHLVDLLQQHGNQLGMPHSKSIGKDLYELRIRGKEEIRLLYCFHKREIVLLHESKKQTQKTPRKEIIMALNRKQSLT